VSVTLEAVGKAIAEEAVKRYVAGHAPTLPKPRYGRFLEAARELSR